MFFWQDFGPEDRHTCEPSPWIIFALELASFQHSTNTHRKLHDEWTAVIKKHMDNIRTPQGVSSCIVAMQLSTKLDTIYLSSINAAKPTVENEIWTSFIKTFIEYLCKYMRKM